MPDPLITVLLVAGPILGLIIGWFIWGRGKSGGHEVAGLQARLEDRDRDNAQLREQVSNLEKERSALAVEVRGMEEQTKALREAHEKEVERMTALKQEIDDRLDQMIKAALSDNHEQFIKTARETFEKHVEEARGTYSKSQMAIEKNLEPFRDRLEGFDKLLRELEQKRGEDYKGLQTEIKSLVELQDNVRKETQILASAMRGSSTRGRWGEIQLRRIVEMAGLTNYCDFDEQTGYTESTEQGSRRLRPDMTVRIPGGRTIIVDAKTPDEHYFAANEAVDEAIRAACLKAHAQAFRTHIRALSSKEYRAQNADSLEFVVMFVPLDPSLSTVMEHDKDLYEYALQNGIVIATPASLIAILKSVAHGWKQHEIGVNARKIMDEARELFKRFNTFFDHFQKMGRSLDQAVDRHNSAVRSLQSRVVPQMNRMVELGAADASDVPEIEQISTVSESVTVALPLAELEDSGSEDADVESLELPLGGNSDEVEEVLVEDESAGG